MIWTSHWVAARHLPLLKNTHQRIKLLKKSRCIPIQTIVQVLSPGLRKVDARAVNTKFQRVMRGNLPRSCWDASARRKLLHKWGSQRGSVGVYVYDSESKNQSMKWRHSGSSSRKKRERKKKSQHKDHLRQSCLLLWRDARLLLWCLFMSEDQVAAVMHVLLHHGSSTKPSPRKATRLPSRPYKPSDSNHPCYTITLSRPSFPYPSHPHHQEIGYIDAALRSCSNSVLLSPVNTNEEYGGQRLQDLYIHVRATRK